MNPNGSNAASGVGAAARSARESAQFGLGWSAALLLALTASGCNAASLQKLLQRPRVVHDYGFGASIVVLRDRDGDGVSEFVVSDPSAGGEHSAFGSVELFDGKSLESVWCVRGEDWSSRASVLDVAGDIDALGAADFIVVSHRHDAGATSGERAGLKACELACYESISLRPRFRIVTERPECALWHDIDADGTLDLLLGVPASTDPDFSFGCVRVFSGRDGALLREVGAPKTIFGFGAAVAELDDVDADGVRDLGIAGRDGLRRCSGSTLLPISGDAVLRTQTTAQLWRTVPDIDGDGRRDVLSGEPDEPRAARFRLHSTRDAQPKRGVVLPGLEETGRGDLYLDSAVIGDVDHDGHGDIVLGAADDTIPGQPSTLACVSGATGSLLWTRRPCDPSRSGARGFLCIRAWDDLNHDGVRECLVGISDYLQFASSFRGHVLVVDGATGATLREID